MALADAERQSAENRARLIRLLFPAVVFGLVSAAAAAAVMSGPCAPIDQRPIANETESPR